MREVSRILSHHIPFYKSLKLSRNYTCKQTKLFFNFIVTLLQLCLKIVSQWTMYMSYYVSNILNIINTPIKRQKQDNSKAFFCQKNIYMYTTSTKFKDSNLLCFNTGKWDCRELSIALDIIYILSILIVPIDIFFYKGC